MLSMMEHSGTHIDALCHQACWPQALRQPGPVAAVEIAAGFTQLGIEHVPPLLTRGVLLDVATWKGETPLPPNYGITADELRPVPRPQNVELRRRRRFAGPHRLRALWQDEAAYLASGRRRPNRGRSGPPNKGVVAVGADNMAWDVIPDRDSETGATLFAHVHLLTKKGIYILENLNLEQLARDRCMNLPSSASPEISGRHRVPHPTAWLWSELAS